MSKKTTQTPFDYSVKTAELEELLVRLQAPDINLDEALSLHSSGKELLAEIEAYLQHAKNEIHTHLAEDN